MAQLAHCCSLLALEASSPRTTIAPTPRRLLSHNPRTLSQVMPSCSFVQRAVAPMLHEGASRENKEILPAVIVEVADSATAEKIAYVLRDAANIGESGVDANGEGALFELEVKCFSVRSVG